MLTKRTKGMFLILGGLACLTIPVHGEAWEFRWDHPCNQTSQTCGGGCQFCFPPPPVTCWCEADWDAAANWTPESTCGVYPDQSTEETWIAHGNTGYCAGQRPARCSQHADCSGQFPFFCTDFEEYLKLDLVTETIAVMVIQVEDTSATDDKLTIRFESKDICAGGSNAGNKCTVDSDCPGSTCDTGGKTLTVKALQLDATNGPITLQVQDSATLQTDGL